MNHFARRQFDLAQLHSAHLRKTDRPPQPNPIAFVEIDLNLSFLKSATSHKAKLNCRQRLRSANYTGGIVFMQRC
jgi:hypothetical protein